ncbi:hypothetical protein F4781DRAFT_379139 [Annulohypoxylon bovei var. microspora]|nr:hypothetical protein F4781DRAFT_379139 [Annulohypoxylon bovei var. microspora]
MGPMGPIENDARGARGARGARDDPRELKSQIGSPPSHHAFLDRFKEHLLNQAKSLQDGNNKTNTGSNRKPGKFKPQHSRSNRMDPLDRQGERRSPALGHVGGSQQSFACPFYCFDKVEHWKCHDRKISTVSYVRQHIKRKHVPPIHCPTCGSEEFDTDALRDKHVNARTCEHRDFPHPWATVEQLDTMDHAANKLHTSSEEERWFDIWDIMCPNRQRPVSPHISKTFWGFLASVIPDAIKEYRRQNRYQQLTDYQTDLGDNDLDSFLRFLEEKEKSPSLTASIPHLSLPSTTLFLNLPESSPRPIIPPTLLQSSQLGVSSFTQSQARDYTSSFPNPFQVPFSTFDESLNSDFPGITEPFGESYNADRDNFQDIESFGGLDWLNNSTSQYQNREPE